MSDLDRLWRIREEEERERRHWRRFKELSDEHWERVRSYDGFSPWFILIVGLLLAAAFIRFAYGYIQALKNPPHAVQTPATQGHPPQNTARRSRAQEAPSRR
jgi:hypothetical protein